LFLSSTSSAVEISVCHSCRLIDDFDIQILAYTLPKPVEVAAACEIFFEPQVLMEDPFLSLGEIPIFKPTIRVLHHNAVDEFFHRTMDWLG
jgi:hypothetical protein